MILYHYAVRLIQTLKLPVITITIKCSRLGYDLGYSDEKERQNHCMAGVL